MARGVGEAYAMAARGSPERGGVPGGEGAHGLVAWALSVSARAGDRSRVFPYHLRPMDFPPPANVKQTQLGAYLKAIITERWMSNTLHHLHHSTDRRRKGQRKIIPAPPSPDL